jgi:hypothetical protein
MTSVLVTDPDGVRWRVHVAWQPRWPALVRRFGAWRHTRKRGRGRRGDGAGTVVDNLLDVGQAAASGRGGGSTGGGGGSGGGFLDGLDLGEAVVVIVVALFAVIALAFLFWWVILPLLLLVLDAVIVLILLVAAVVGRVLFRRPWTVEALADGQDTVVVPVVGWRAALRRRDDMVDLLRQGQPPEALIGRG